MSESIENCGFALLQGEGVHVLLRKYEIILGRYSKGAPVDVVLGETMNISRQHGKIVYNFATKCFDLVVLSKNGISVNHTLFTPQSQPKPLHSRDLLQVGDKSFHFLLPRARRALPSSHQNSLPPSSSAPTAGTSTQRQPSQSLPHNESVVTEHGSGSLHARGEGGELQAEAKRQRFDGQEHSAVQQQQQQQGVHRGVGGSGQQGGSASFSLGSGGVSHAHQHAAPQQHAPSQLQQQQPMALHLQQQRGDMDHAPASAGAGGVVYERQ